jgi:hypothetical protein
MALGYTRAPGGLVSFGSSFPLGVFNGDPMPVKTESTRLSLAEVAAAVRFVARNRFWGVEAVLWALCHSPGLIRTCLTTPPAPHAYAKIAGLDGGVQALLLASLESRSLLRSGIHSSPSAVRQRVKTAAPPASTASLTPDDVIAAFHLVAWTRPSAIDALLWAVCQSPTLVAQLVHVNGTSFAAPMAAAIAAMVFVIQPSWTAEDVWEAMKINALDLGDPGRDDLHGDGFLQAQATLEYARDYVFSDGFEDGTTSRWSITSGVTP